MGDIEGKEKMRKKKVLFLYFRRDEWGKIWGKWVRGGSGGAKCGSRDKKEVDNVKYPRVCLQTLKLQWL